ncbi:MAG TPA: acyl-CoA dehydrogenase family protein [Ilumatobacteraceae bacterium]
MIRSFLDPDEVAFLDDVEEFFSARPTDPFGFYHGRGGDARRLYQELGARGWLSLGWPVEVGGAAKPPTYDFIVWNTSARHRAARPDLGPGIIAHVLTVYGTEDQQARYLPGLASGSTCFALGYSEPEAGSDLTGLRTRALVDGDNYVVSGEKCWTSDAHHSDYLWLLCRTGSLEDRGRALTLLIVDMHAPGVTVTPIETIDGHRLNQVFLDGVVVPSFDRVGAEGAAWTIIREALAVERHLQLLPGRLERDLADLRCVLERSGRLADRQGAAVFAELTARFRQVEASSMVTLAELCAGRPAVEAAARTKFLGTRLAQAIPRAAIDLCGADALDLAEPMPFLWRQSFMETIAGGTSEVMLSIMARGELGLGARS